MPESLGPLLWGMQGSQCVGLRRVGGLAARGMIHGLPGELLGPQLTVQAKSPGEALLAAVSFSNTICVCVCTCMWVCVCVCVGVCVYGRVGNDCAKSPRASPQSGEEGRVGQARIRLSGETSPGFRDEDVSLKALIFSGERGHPPSLRC